MIIVLGLNRQILFRIEKLYRALEEIGQSGNLSSRVDLKGRDELTFLAHRFNETLDALQFSKKALRENQDRLQHDAKHDPLTGFINRTRFNEILSELIEEDVVPSTLIHAVLITDLDEFKYINDSFNHEIGDQFLIAYSMRLKHCIRADDVVARLGGDEFSILLKNISSKSEAIQVAQRIQHEMRTPFETDGQKIFLNVSIGIAFTGDDLRSEDLMRNADIALYHAKSNGKARYEIFDHTMHSISVNRLQLETALRHAIEQKQFVVYYQPIISLKTGKIISLEALVRWQHPTLGLTFPAEFITLAEKTGLILPLGEFVLHTALQQLKIWIKEGNTALKVAINVSPCQLQSETFLRFVTTELASYGVPGENLELEITESAMFTNLDRTLATLNDLKQSGVSFSIDDFGTGYSSLAYLT